VTVPLNNAETVFRICISKVCENGAIIARNNAQMAINVESYGFWSGTESGRGTRRQDRWYRPHQVRQGLDPMLINIIEEHYCQLGRNAMTDQAAVSSD
jgi:hypothetical protein